MSFVKCNTRGSGIVNHSASTSQMPAATKKEPVDLNATQAFCLRWNNYQTNMVNVLDQIFHDEKYVDVTLVCEGTFIKAHKIVLSACSPYFQHIFDTVASPHPVIILKDMLLTELKPILDFMYKGEIYVAKDQIGILLRVAENLKVRGLAEVAEENATTNTNNSSANNSANSSGNTKTIPNEPTAKKEASEATKKTSRLSKRKPEMSSTESLILCDGNEDQVKPPLQAKKKKASRQNPRKQSFANEEIKDEGPVEVNDIQFEYDDYPVEIGDDFKEETMSEHSVTEKVSWVFQIEI